MRPVKLCISGALVGAIFISGCAYLAEDPVASRAVAGGLIGGGIGAGTGALIGNAISGGDVGKSALVGGAIGVPVGAALLVGYYNYQRWSIVRKNERQIELNRSNIEDTQFQIESLRPAISAASAAFEFDYDRSEWIYDGPSLGVYSR